MTKAQPDARTSEDRIAIIGMAGRFPGANSVDELWENLTQGVESLTELTDEQLIESGVPEEVFTSEYYIRKRPVLEGLEDFDAGYFGYTKRNADITDPQQRLFLEVADSALQNAGYEPSGYQGTIGVYAGSGPDRYHFERVYPNARVRAAVGDMAIELGNALDYLATQVAYSLGLRGPAITVATACSTALVAVHSAVRALESGECDMAVAGGVHVLFPCYRGEMWAENGIHARDGRVRPFDADACGTNFGYGAGAVILKRYDRAVADGDHIDAVVLGSALNNDGAARPGFSAPSRAGQTAVIRQALADAGDISPDTIGFVEGHGTATTVGDPIEVAALSAAYREAGGTRRGSVPLGSLKANIGHLGPAAGIAGLIKTVLMMRHRMIPPTINVTTPNPAIGFEETPFYVNTELTPWPETTGHPRRAGVSSFGIGGTNAHVIVEEPPPPAAGPESGEPAATGGRAEILPLSARSAAALDTARRELAAHLRAHPELRLADVAHTLRTGRRELPVRSAVVCASTEAAAAALDKPGKTATAPREPAEVTFLFPGQGAQYPGMAAELYASEPVFSEALNEAAKYLPDGTTETLLPLLTEADQPDAEAAARLRETRFAQPALFLVEYALAALWRSRGVEPAAMVGHSVGEYTAACLAGVFTLPDAVRLVAERARLTQEMPPGAMLAVPLPEEDLEPFLTDGVGLAAVNSPKNCVVSGPADEVEVLAGLLTSFGIRSQRLHTSHAFHSAMLDPVVEPFETEVARAAPQSPRIPIVSTLTGTWLTAEEATDPGYWSAQLRGTVRFAEACQLAAEHGTALLETGPSQNLTTLARQTLGKDAAVVPSLGPASSDLPVARRLAEATAALWTHGVPVAWPADGAPRRRVALPGYPYERSRHWVDLEPADSADESPAASAKPSEYPVEDATHLPVWRRSPVVPPTDGAPESALWLVLAAESGPVVADGVRQLLGAGHRAVLVRAGTEYADHGDGRFTVDPSSRDDYDQLLLAVEADHGRPTRVLHGWTATPATDDALSDTELDQVRTTGFDSLLFLTQSMRALWADHAWDVRVVTTRAFDVTGSDPVEPAKALLTGPCQVIPLETPELRHQLIDVGDDGCTAAQLVEELHGAAADRLVAYRAGRRWTAGHEQVTLPPRAELPGTLRRRGVYLLTGGLGSIGLDVARELARTVDARLVLVSRGGLPDRAEWDGHLAAHDPADPLARRINAVRELEELGSEVLVARADVADEDAMRQVVAAARERFGRIHGVFHAAGLAGGGLSALRSVDDAHTVLAPKVTGTAVLDRLLGDEVELMVLFSSIVTVSGYYGMTDYCAANAFLDAYAQSRRRATGCHTVAVNWCGWLNGGMLLASRDTTPDAMRALSTRGMDSDDGAATAPTRSTAHPLLGNRRDDDGHTVFHADIYPDYHWVLAEHRINDTGVFPGTALIEMMRAAYAEIHGDGPVEIAEVLFSRPLEVAEPTELQVRGTPRADGTAEFMVRCRPAGRSDAPWQHHARCTITRAADDTEPPQHDLAALTARCDEEFLEIRQRFTEGTSFGMVTFGDHWPSINSFRVGRGEHLVALDLDAEQCGDLDSFVLHPSLLDGCTSLSLHAPEVFGDHSSTSYLPSGYERLIVRAPLSARLRVHVRSSLPSADGSAFSCDIGVLDERGRELVTIEGFTVTLVDVAQQQATAQDGPPARTPDSDRGTAPVTETADARHGGEIFITPDDGIALLWRVLDSPGEAQFLVSREDPARRAERLERLAAGLGSADITQLASSGNRAEDSETAAPEPVTATEGRLRELWMDAFSLSRVRLDEDFFDLGGNSLVAVQLAVRIRETFGVNVPGVAVLEHPTLRELAQRVDQEIAESRDEAKRR